jgi:t-SNARE complex subunit (syntaxin)
MEPQPLEEVVRNVDMRLTRVEQILPTLATKTELQEAIAPLATKVELREVRSELREEMRREGERTRRHFDVVTERLEGHIRLIAEGQVLLQERFEDLRTDLKADIAQLDRRVMRLEATR